MADLQSDIFGKVLYFQDMLPIIISGDIGDPVNIQLYSDIQGIILDESYYPDFSGHIELDIKDVIAADMYLTIPGDKDMQQEHITRQYSLTVDDSIRGTFDVCGFSEDALECLTDIDVLRIPQNYLLPISIPNAVGERTGLIYRHSEGIERVDDILTTIDDIGVTSRMVNIETSPVVNKGSFVIELPCDTVTLYTAIFQICKGRFEQYLFANRYGGFDNLPMDGQREFIPDFTFKSGRYSSGNEQISAEADYIYSQNSGFQSQKVLELASELLCSPQIYHLDHNGSFRRIIILESTVASQSNETLHSFSFKYKYADDARPAALRYRGASQITVLQSKGSTYTHLQNYASSKWVITHNLSRHPSVTIVDSAGTSLFGDVTYDSDNQITIRFSAPFSGKAYLN